MQEFNNVALAQLRAAMLEALENMGMEDLQFEVSGMRYTSTEVDIKVKCNIKGQQTRGQSALERMCERHYLNTTNSNGDELVEYRHRNTKYPFMYRKANGQMMKTDLAHAKFLFS